jgi:putative inorganic carbon (hco3(-)) transporter
MKLFERLLPDVPSSARPAYAAFAAFAFAVPVVRLGLVPVGSTMLQVADLLFLACAALYLHGLVRRTIALPPRRWIAASVIFFAAAAVSIVGTENPKASLVKLLATGYLLTIAAVTYGLGSQSKAALRFVLASWGGAAALTGLLGVVGVAMFYAGVRDRTINIFLWNHGSIPVGSYPRVVVLFMNANMLCSYLLVGLGALGMLAPLVERGWLRWMLLVGAAMCVTATFTLSTGLGGIALSVALGWILWRHRLKKVRFWREGAVGVGALAGAAGFAVITVFLLVPKGQGDMNLGPVDLSFETSGRVSVWESSAETFANHPVKGIGIGTLVALTSHPRALNTVDKLGTTEMNTKPTRMEAHNVWLNVAAQVGLLGLVPFLALIALVTRTAWPRAFDSSPWAEVKIAAFACLIGALYYHGFFGSFEDSRQYWFLFGAILSVGKLAEVTKAPETESPAMIDTAAPAVARST